MKELLDIIFPTLSDELIIVISLIIGLLVTASLILFLVKKISPKTNISELSPPCPAPPPETRPATRPERCETACRSPPHGQSPPEQAYAPARTAISANS